MTSRSRVLGVLCATIGFVALGTRTGKASSESKLPPAVISVAVIPMSQGEEPGVGEFALIGQSPNWGWAWPYAGGTQHFKAIVHVTGGSSTAVTWSSSYPSISVDSDGWTTPATGLAAQAEICATSVADPTKFGCFDLRLMGAVNFVLNRTVLPPGYKCTITASMPSGIYGLSVIGTPYYGWSNMLESLSDATTSPSFVLYSSKITEEPPYSGTIRIGMTSSAAYGSAYKWFEMSVDSSASTAGCVPE